MPADILELKVYNENMPIPVKLIDTRTGENLENE
jgi:hypothetical protein